MRALVIRPYSVSALARHHYQDQNSQQTLAEGLEEYYRANEGIVARPETLSPQSATLFRSHDICHVIFGLDTTLGDETLADTRTFLSCDVGWKKYSNYINDPLAMAVFKELGIARAVWITLRSVPRILRAIIEAKRMAKKWPWVPPESFRSRTLADLRKEFAIRVM